MSDRLVTIATFNTVMEASIARNKLAAEGVKVFLADGTMSDMAWHLGVAIGGVKVQVMENDAEFALSLLQADSVQAVGEEIPPEDGSDEHFESEVAEADEDQFVYPADELVDRAFRAAVFGIIFLPLQFYSLWLLCRISRCGAALTAQSRRRILITVLIDSWLIIVFMLSVWLRMP